MPRAYRYRQCPRCRVILPAGQFGPARLGPGAWHTGGRWPRECPACGCVGATRDFARVEAEHDEEAILPPPVSIDEQIRRIVGRR